MSYISIQQSTFWWLSTTLNVFNVIDFKYKNSDLLQSEKIIVYGSNDCHYCVDAKRHLTKNNIDYIFYDIDKNHKALQEMLIKLRKAKISTSNLSIPVIDKNGAMIMNNGNFESFLKTIAN